MWQWFTDRLYFIVPARGWEQLMATVLELDAKVDRILGDVGDVAAEVAELRLEIEELQNREVILAADLDPILAKLGNVEDGLDAIVPDPIVVEDPEPEPEPEPEPVIE
jgi:predicted aspartyl protease